MCESIRNFKKYCALTSVNDLMISTLCCHPFSRWSFGILLYEMITLGNINTPVVTLLHIHFNENVQTK